MNKYILVMTFAVVLLSVTGCLNIDTSSSSGDSTLTSTLEPTPVEASTPSPNPSMAPQVLNIQPVSGSIIQNNREIFISFSAIMNPNSCSLSGTMISEEVHVNFISGLHVNEALLIFPTLLWNTGNGKTLIASCRDITGQRNLLSLTYDVIDSTPPTVLNVFPDNGTAISSVETDIFITFSEPMNTLITLGGTMGAQNPDFYWSNSNRTISIFNVWSVGDDQTLIIDGTDVNGVPLEQVVLIYNIY